MIHTARLGALLGLLAACGSAQPAATPDVPAADLGAPDDRTAPLCTPGRTKACPCASGAQGAQTCQRDGTYGACVCFDAGVPADVLAIDTAVDAGDRDAQVFDATNNDVTSDVVGDGPVRGVYARCNADDRCAAGACLVSSVQPSGMTAARHCSARCGSGSAMECPGYVRGQVECIAPEGSLMFAQCFRLCQSMNDCAPFNTICTQIMQPAGPIRVCVPTA